MSEQKNQFKGITRTKEETEKMYPPKSKYEPKPVHPPKDIKTVDSSDEATRIPKRP